MGDQLYNYTRDQHEYHIEVPPVMTGDEALEICVSAHGGGTVGKAYAGNGWDYAVYHDGLLVIEGSDIRSPEGRPAGHAETARSLASFLSAAGEHAALYPCPDLTHCPSGWCDCDDNSYTPDERNGWPPTMSGSPCSPATSTTSPASRHLGASPRRARPTPAN